MQAETIAYVFGAAHRILMANLAGITHEESLTCARETANGINWLTGHILNSRGRLARVLGAGGPFLTERESTYYGRGSRPIHAGDPCANLDQLVGGLRLSAEEISARLATMTDAELDAEIDLKLFPIPPDKPTVSAMVTFLLFHEAYHNGQIALNRRAMGKTSGIGV